METNKDQALNLIRKFTGHNFVKFMASGNAAIFCAVYLCKSDRNKFLIPDQGGWLTYKTYPQILGLEVKEIKTDHGFKS